MINLFLHPCLWLLLFFFFILKPNPLTAQNIFLEKNTEIAIGYAIIPEKLPEGYDYSPLFIAARFPVYQFSSVKKSSFNIFVEPQFVINTPSEQFKNTFEFGLNLSLLYFFPFSDKNGLSVSIGSGPHYLSLKTEKQAKGFIFSDNFEIGYYQKIGERFGFSLKPRFRHISNAGFQSPNEGIDNFFVMVGLFWKK